MGKGRENGLPQLHNPVIHGDKRKCCYNSVKKSIKKIHKSKRNKSLSSLVLAVRFVSIENPKEEKNCLFSDWT